MTQPHKLMQTASLLLTQVPCRLNFGTSQGSATNTFVVPLELSGKILELTTVVLATAVQAAARCRRQRAMPLEPMADDEAEAVDERQPHEVRLSRQARSSLIMMPPPPCRVSREAHARWCRHRKISVE